MTALRKVLWPPLAWLSNFLPHFPLDSSLPYHLLSPSLASGPRRILPLICGGGRWHWFEELTGSPSVSQPGVVFENHRPWLWLSDLPDTTCCCLSSSSGAGLPCGPRPPALCCGCPMGARPLWHHKRTHLGSRKKLIFICLLPTEGKSNINNHNKYLVSAYYYSFNCWPFHPWPWWETCHSLLLKRPEDTRAQTYWAYHHWHQNWFSLFYPEQARGRGKSGYPPVSLFACQVQEQSIQPCCIPRRCQKAGVHPRLRCCHQNIR